MSRLLEAGAVFTVCSRVKDQLAHMLPHASKPLNHKTVQNSTEGTFDLMSLFTAEIKKKTGSYQGSEAGDFPTARFWHHTPC